LIPAVTVTNEMKSKGDFLVNLMRGQLKNLLKRHIEIEAKKNYWVIQLAFKNFPIVAGYMIVLDHVKSDLTRLDYTMSLLSPNIDRFLLCNTFPQHVGAHLYFETHLGVFVRRGKVTGYGFSVRYEEHETKLSKRNASSNFYFSFHPKR
jgi:hypothetical protein